MTQSVILIVDDEPNVLKSIKRLLIDSDYKILLASSGEEGLKKIESAKVDVVISDYRMPGMNGVEFLSKVKDISPDTMRIILSGYADAVAIVEAINEGQVYKFITKPWNDQELLTTIITSIEQHNLQQEYEMLYHELQRKNKALEDSKRTLEDEVKRRTYDLEIKNRALMLARNILNYLPVGVLGVDPNENIVYMNNAINIFLPGINVSLGKSAGEVIPNVDYQLFKKCLEAARVFSKVINKDKSIGAVWVPLPDLNGAIGLYHFIDLGYYEVAEYGLKPEIGVGYE